jgi:hypothetical protein
MIARVNRVMRFRGQYYRLVVGQKVGKIPKELEKNLLSAGLIKPDSAVAEKPKVLLMEEPAPKKRRSKKKEEEVEERRTDVDAEDSGEERVSAGSEGSPDNSAE